MWRNELYKVKRVLIFVLILLTMSCSKVDYCEKLELIIEDPDKASFMVDWVDKNFKDSLIQIDHSKYILGGGMWPGQYWYPTEFDWSRLGFRKDSQIRLLGENTENGFRLISIYFGERTRQGLLVKYAESSTFGVSEEHIVSKNGRVAAVCRSDTR